MSRLPLGWESAPLKELVSGDGLFADGDWVESKDQDPNGGIRLLQLADVGDGRFLDKSCRYINQEKFLELRCTELQTNDVLVARMPDPLGRACLLPMLDQRCVTVVDVAVIRPGEDGVNCKWLVHGINSPYMRRAMENSSSGTTRKRISRGNLGELLVKVPPLTEQTRIADKLDTVLTRVDACRDRLARVAPLLKRFRQSVLAAATSGRLTEDWRTANPHSPGYSKTELNQHRAAIKNRLKVPRAPACLEDGLLYSLPVSWSWVLNHELARDNSNSICAGPFGTIFKAADFRSSGIPIIFLINPAIKSITHAAYRIDTDLK